MKNDKNKQRYNGEETDNDQDNRRNALAIGEQVTWGLSSFPEYKHVVLSLTFLSKLLQQEEEKKLQLKEPFNSLNYALE